MKKLLPTVANLDSRDLQFLKNDNNVMQVDYKDQWEFTNSRWNNSFIMIWVHTNWITFEVKSKLAKFHVFQLIFMQIRPPPNSGIYDMWEAFPSSHLKVQSKLLQGTCLCKTCLRNTCSLPSSVRWMVTHLLGWAPFVVIAVIKLSSSSLFS